MTFGVHFGRNGINRVTRHEVTHVQVLYLQVGTIVLGTGVEESLRLQQSPTLTSCDVCLIFLTCRLHPTLCRHRR